MFPCHPHTTRKYEDVQKTHKKVQQSMGKTTK